MSGASGRVSAFAPASVSNVACGFDVLGFAIAGAFEGVSDAAPLGDVVHASAASTPGAELVSVTGDGGRLPRDSGRNTAAVAAAAVLERCRPTLPADALPGVSLELEKGMPLASGLGSSAASAVAAVVATHELARAHGAESLDARALVRCALAGERVASGGEHADNVAPSLVGGFVLIRSLDPEPDLIDLPVPAGLSCAVVRPHLEVATLAARAALGERIALRAAIAQWGNVGALVAALHRGDLDLLSRALRDAVAEPVRAGAVPGFAAAMAAARAAGALGGSLSGSGPSLFALAPDAAAAERAVAAMAAALAGEGIACDRLVTPVGGRGAHRLEAPGGQLRSDRSGGSDRIQGSERADVEERPR
ncbi:MAG TPA: homoserine kinase [Thermoanaerobaculia bacterium]|nr:homoserine kinase [Thermoanaerobaculia bacterium]